MEKDALIKNLEKFDSIPHDLRDFYEMLEKIYRFWVDTSEENYKILSLWTLGSMFQDSFETYPYLFLNAMKGSGKSRVLKLMAFILDGTHTASLTPAVLFRERGPLMLDEAENMGGKEKSNLKELLNFAYKSGGVVKRSRKDIKTEEQIIDTFDVFRPIALANISGLDDVLESRCITLTLEKSYNPEITRKVELFKYDPIIKHLKANLVSVVPCRMVISEIYKGIASLLNALAPSYTINTTYITNISDTTDTITAESFLIYDKIKETKLLGRDFELWLPLLTISSVISEELLNEVVKISEIFAAERQEMDIIENRDVSLVSFLLNFMDGISQDDFIPLSSIVSAFLEFEPECKWFSSEWVGRSLKRNNLMLEKRRLAKGREVRINLKKLESFGQKFGIDILKSREEYKKQKEEQSMLSTPSKLDHYIHKQV